MRNEHTETALVAKLEQIKHDMLEQINADLFFDGRGRGPSRAPRSWFVRWGWRVQRYVSTLWKALRGVELEEPRGWD